MIGWPGIIRRKRGGDKKPLILFYNKSFGEQPALTRACSDTCVFTTDRRALSRAAAVIFHIPTLRKRKRIAKRPGQLWVAWSMESDVNYPLLADPEFMRRFDLTMTYRRSADIWCPYVPGLPAFERALSAPVPAKTADAPMVMFQSATLDRSGRNLFSVPLMSHISTHSYGRFLNNRELPFEDRGIETKRSVIGSYKFCVAFENSIAVDYVTEKFFEPLLAGSVPVYRGAPNIDEFSPGAHAYIDASKFSGPRELAEYLTALDRDDAAYNEYFKWREGGLSDAFRQLLSAAPADPVCRLCEIVAERFEKRQ